MPADVDAFMATMVMHSPPLSLEGATGLVREYYGLDTHAVRLTGERDENFRVRAADGSEYVLKLAHPAEDPAVSDLATAALLHLESHDPALPCPRVVRERSGRTQVAFRDETGVERTARLLSYLPGQPLLSVAGSRDLRGACGGWADGSAAHCVLSLTPPRTGSSSGTSVTQRSWCDSSGRCPVFRSGGKPAPCSSASCRSSIHCSPACGSR